MCVYKYRWPLTVEQAPTQGAQLLDTVEHHMMTPDALRSFILNPDSNGMSSLNNVCISHLRSSPEPIQQWAGVAWALQLSDQPEHQSDQASSLLRDSFPSCLSLNMIRVPRKTLLNLPMDHSCSGQPIWCCPPNPLFAPLIHAFQYFSFPYVSWAMSKSCLSRGAALFLSSEPIYLLPRGTSTWNLSLMVP